MGGFFDDPVEKQVYDVEYKKMKEAGYPFHPFATWKDVVVALALLLLLLALTFIQGVHLDAPADPTSQYLPRPEWYFMWLFELLKYFPGPWAIFAVAIIPGGIAGALLLLPFYDRNPYRRWTKRPVATVMMSLLMLFVVGLTARAYWADAHDPHAQELLKGASAGHGSSGGTPPGGARQAGADGQAIFSAKCVMCHGPTKKNMPQANLASKAFLDGRDIVNSVTNGKGGMPSFKGQLSEGEIKAVTDWLKASTTEP
ncbi:MAG: c-type cytochrome [Candidatus Sericytochromatia bacterium]|nr:c-type cytochrome [Candidatus Sericytochromatia bacterium]